MSNVLRLGAVNCELEKCFRELSMLQSEWAVSATRKVAAAEYIHDVIDSIGDRRGRYPALAADRAFADLLVGLHEIGTFVSRPPPPKANSVNSSVATHGTDDKIFIAKVLEQLRLLEAEQIRIRPQAEWAQLTGMIANVIGFFGVVSDAIERYRDHLRERQAERAQAAAHGDVSDDSD